MALQIAETKFITRADSGLAAVDVYGATPPQSAVNAGASTIGLPPGFKTPNTAGQINKIVDGLTDALNKSKGKSIKDIYKAVKTVVGGKEALLENFKTNMVTDILTNMGFSKTAKEMAGVIVGGKDPTGLIGIIGKENPECAVIVNGIQTITKASDIDTAQGIAKLLNNLSGNKELIKVLDLEPQNILLKSMLDNAARLRMPVLVDAVLEKAQTKKDRKQLLTAVTPKAAVYSDIDTINLTMDEIGDTNTYEAYPEVVESILGFYVTASGETPTVDDEKQLFDTLDRLKQEWWLIDRNGVKVFNLDMFATLSDHAKEILARRPELRPAVAMSNIYRPRMSREVKLDTRPWALV